MPIGIFFCQCACVRSCQRVHARVCERVCVCVRVCERASDREREREYVFLFFLFDMNALKMDLPPLKRAMALYQ